MATPDVILPDAEQSQLFVLDAGHIIMFERALGEPDRGVPGLDADGIIPPPTFLQASRCFDRTNPWRPEPSDDGGHDAIQRAREARGRGLHAEQSFEYHRHPRAGEVLTYTRRGGDTWTKVGSKGGEMTFTETITEFRDAAGELVVTSRHVGVRVQKPPTQSDGTA